MTQSVFCICQSAERVAQWTLANVMSKTFEPPTMDTERRAGVCSRRGAWPCGAPAPAAPPARRRRRRDGAPPAPGLPRLRPPGPASDSVMWCREDGGSETLRPQQANSRASWTTAATVHRQRTASVDTHVEATWPPTAAYCSRAPPMPRVGDTHTARRLASRESLARTTNETLAHTTMCSLSRHHCVGKGANFPPRQRRGPVCLVRHTHRGHRGHDRGAPERRWALRGEHEKILRHKRASESGEGQSMPGDANARAGSGWGSGPWHTRTGKRVGRDVHRDLGRVTARLCGSRCMPSDDRQS